MDGQTTQETTTTTYTEAITSVGDSLTTNINPGVIASVIGIVLTSCIALFLTWFGIRKLISAVTRALRGRLSV